MIFTLPFRYSILKTSFCFVLFMYLLPGVVVAQDQSIQTERKTCIVTGATGELGAATAKILAPTYNLILTGRNIQVLQTLQEELKNHYPGHYEICTLDYVDSLSRKAFKKYLKKNNHNIAGLVLIMPRPHTQSKDFISKEEVWLKIFKSLFTGPLEALRCVLPHLSKAGKIVVIAGTTSVEYNPNMPVSCVTSRMWTTYIKELAYQLGPREITVNALSPGVVLTKFHQERIAKQARENKLKYEKQLEKEVANIPLQRHAYPEEVAKAIQFLLSDSANFINGTNLVLDGGLTFSYD